eukprot:Mycagemm_TRINITY_DN10110_c0_g1::TRINITY_DN10110_c0_g1_i1::g.5027::m.5027 type:complete len:474 gc:universal TRINITY_DN10110_c0_g1_i1:2343-922(-)
MMRDMMGTHLTLPSLSFDTMPGRTSISSPTLSTPCRMEPPATPPFSSSTSAPGLFTSNERITMRRGEEVKLRFGMGIFLQMYSQITSMLYLSCALMGMMGAFSATVPCTNFRICLCCSAAAESFMRSILFCRMMMCCRRMISMAAKCSEVCGCGQGSLPAMRSSAASMTAAPLSMVAMRMSWPGQLCATTNVSSSTRPSPSTAHLRNGATPTSLMVNGTDMAQARASGAPRLDTVAMGSNSAGPLKRTRSLVCLTPFMTATRRDTCATKPSERATRTKPRNRSACTASDCSRSNWPPLYEPSASKKPATTAARTAVVWNNSGGGMCLLLTTPSALSSVKKRLSADTLDDSVSAHARPDAVDRLTHTVSRSAYSLMTVKPILAATVAMRSLISMSLLADSVKRVSTAVPSPSHRPTSQATSSADAVPTDRSNLSPSNSIGLARYMRALVRTVAGAAMYASTVMVKKTGDLSAAS